jgi:pimeloyl-ACP methyl ester carboxylesterase
MSRCAQGLHAFLRAYYHMKSADWPENRPFPLRSASADELAKMPTYYIMDLAHTMAETVAPHMPPPAAVAACRWLPEDDLRVYSEAFARTGLQGGLNWYRCALDPRHIADMQIFSGRTIDVPSVFIAGRADWGPYQKPGIVEAMQATACTRMLGCHFVDGAGHWVQQEQPEATTRLLLDFLARTPG